MKNLLVTAALSLAALGSHTAHAAAQSPGTEVLDEGFGSVGGLSGWVQVNDSVPQGSGWFQGNPGLFTAQSGPADSYAAASFLGAANGNGTVDNWLITPTLALSGTTVLSFFTRAGAASGFDDTLEVRFSSGDGTDPAGFTTLLATFGGAAGYPSDWAAYTASLNAGGSGRFAFRYVGAADTLNYVGLDTVSVVTAVPEPSSRMMLALGAGALPLLVRMRRRTRHGTRHPVRNA